MTLTKALEMMATVLPAEVVEMFKAHFQMIYASNQLNVAYDKANPKYANKGCLNKMYIADKHNLNLAEVEDKIWNRACTALNNWLYDAYCEEYVKDEDDEK